LALRFPPTTYSRPATPAASIRDGLADILLTACLVGADINMDTAVSIARVNGRERRIRRDPLRLMTDTAPSPLRMDFRLIPALIIDPENGEETAHDLCNRN